jgi:hypothetical protein
VVKLFVGGVVVQEEVRLVMRSSVVVVRLMMILIADRHQHYWGRLIILHDFIKLFLWWWWCEQVVCIVKCRRCNEEQADNNNRVCWRKGALCERKNDDEQQVVWLGYCATVNYLGIFVIDVIMLLLSMVVVVGDVDGWSKFVVVLDGVDVSFAEEAELFVLEVVDDAGAADAVVARQQGDVLRGRVAYRARRVVVRVRVGVGEFQGPRLKVGGR